MTQCAKPGGIVISKAGHDKGEALIVLKTDEKGFIYAADGKSRSAARPKRKNPKHVRVLQYRSDAVEKILLSGNLPDNALIQRELKVYLNEVSLKKQGDVDY